MLLAPNGDPLPRVVDTASARELGFTARTIAGRLARREWSALTRGVYFTRLDEPERVDWIRAGLIIGGPQSVLSGWDAVRARGIGPANPPVDEVLVLTPDGTHRVIGGAARIRPSHRPLAECPRLPVSNARIAVRMAPASRAVADTALVLRSPAAARALVAAAVQRKLCTVDELIAEYEEGPRNGSAHLRLAIIDVTRGAESLPEAVLADTLVGAGLPPFEMNVPIVDVTGRLLATADVLWRALRAVLEVDSRAHHFAEDKWLGTMRRHNRFGTFGLAATHYAPVDIRDYPQTVTAEVADWLRWRSLEVGVNLASLGPPGATSGKDRPYVVDVRCPAPLTA